MRRIWATVYAVFCTIALCVGFFLVFFFAWVAGTRPLLYAIFGMAVGLIVSPIVHELGHVVFGALAKMDCVYVKCFCFKIYIKNGKKRLGFASPFAADQTQMLPKMGGNMRKRAMRYILGGQIFSGVFFILLLITVIVVTLFVQPIYFLWSIISYAGYLFLLNLLPFEYASGKTDIRIYQGLRRGEAAEKIMLTAMEIQGRLYEGYSFAEIDERYYLDLPLLPEDEPLFAVIMDLRYRYYLEKNDYDKASDSLNRLAQAEPYLSDEEVQKLIGELTYMHALGGNIELAEKSAKLCEEYLKRDEVEPKRILAAYAKAVGNTEGVEILLKQARGCISKEYIKGIRKAEAILCARLEA